MILACSCVYSIWCHNTEVHVFRQLYSVALVNTSDRMNEQADNECFVELHCAQTALPGMAALRNLHDDVMDETTPVSVRYGGFVVNINGEVDERQLAAVLRAMKNAD